MDIVLSLLGAALVAFVLFDMLWTTMGEGGGPLSRRIMNKTWRAFLRVFRNRDNRRLYSFAGIGLIILILILWIALLWLGWTLIFLYPEGAVIDLQEGTPADFWDRVYFMGFTIFTLGIGDFRPEGSLYQVLTNVASVSGLFLVTMAITYILSVVQAATQKRQLAVYIASLGRTAEEILVNTWNGERFDALEDHLVPLTSQLADLKQRHLTYPALHYFQGIDPYEASALSVASLDDALSIIALGMEPGKHINDGLLQAARHVLAEFLNTLDATFVDPAEDVPPLPSLQTLRNCGLPVVDDERFDQRMASQERRRRLLLALVLNDAWEWDLLLPEHQDERVLEPDEA